MGLIRNFSIGGASIEVDADLRIGDTVSYFWEANSCISAKVVWRDGKACGLEHTDEVRKASKAFPSRSVRVPCKAEADCWIGGQRNTALVENISLGGMRVGGLPQLEAGALVTIEFCGLEFHSVQVRWFKDGRAGLRFANRMTREILAQLLLDERFALSNIDFSVETDADD